MSKAGSKLSFVIDEDPESAEAARSISKISSDVISQIDLHRKAFVSQYTHLLETHHMEVIPGSMKTISGMGVAEVQEVVAMVPNGVSSSLIDPLRTDCPCATITVFITFTGANANAEEQRAELP